MAGHVEMAALKADVTTRKIRTLQALKSNLARTWIENCAPSLRALSKSYPRIHRALVFGVEMFASKNAVAREVRAIPQRWQLCRQPTEVACFCLFPNHCEGKATCLEKQPWREDVQQT